MAGALRDRLGLVGRRVAAAAVPVAAERKVVMLVDGRAVAPVVVAHKVAVAPVPVVAALEQAEAVPVVGARGRAVREPAVVEQVAVARAVVEQVAELGAP